MNKEVIKQIKELPGVKTVSSIYDLTEDAVIVTFNPIKKLRLLGINSIGQEIFENDEVWHFRTKDHDHWNKYTIEHVPNIGTKGCHQAVEESEYFSECYITEKDCEIALANYIVAKYK